MQTNLDVPGGRGAMCVSCVLDVSPCVSCHTMRDWWWVGLLVRNARVQIHPRSFWSLTASRIPPFSYAMGYCSSPDWMQWHSDNCADLYIYMYMWRSLWIRALGTRLLHFVFTLGLMEESIKMSDKFSVLTVFKEKLDILGHSAGSLFTSVI